MKKISGKVSKMPDQPTLKKIARQDAEALATGLTTAQQTQKYETAMDDPIYQKGAPGFSPITKVKDVMRPLLLTIGLATIGILTANAAGPKWVEVRTPHFRIVGEANADQLRGVARQFEQFRSVFDRMTNGGIRGGERPLVVLAARDERALRLLIPDFWEGRTAKPVGVFVSGLDTHTVALRLDAHRDYEDFAREIGIPINPWHTVFHEYIHSLLQSNARLPLWLNEGFAEFYGNSRVERARAVMGIPQPTALWHLRNSTLLPLEKLLAVDQASPLYRDQQRAELFYAQSWALVHFLRVGNAGANRGLLKAYADQIDSGADAVTAARLAFGDLQALERRLVAYIRSPTFSQELLPGDTAVDETAWTVQSLPERDVALLRARLHLDLGRFDRARALIEPIASNQSYAPALDLLGLVHDRQGRTAEATATLSAAIAAGTKSALTYWRAAVLRRREGSSDADSKRQVRLWLQQAVVLDPTFGPAYTGLAEMFLESGEKPEDVLLLAQRAILLSPRQPGPMIVAGRALLRLNRRAEAVALGARALAIASSDAERDQARDFLAEAKGQTDRTQGR